MNIIFELVSIETHSSAKTSLLSGKLDYEDLLTQSNVHFKFSSKNEKNSPLSGLFGFHSKRDSYRVRCNVASNVENSFADIEIQQVKETQNAPEFKCLLMSVFISWEDIFTKIFKEGSNIHFKEAIDAYMSKQNASL